MHLALDLSKTSAGWALWGPGQSVPACGTWELGCSLTSAGRAFLRLHQRLNEIHAVSPLESVTYEKPLNLGMGSVQTSEATLFLLIGLAAHVESYCDAKGIRRCRSVHQATWRRHFLGALKRGTKTKALKDYAVERCRQLGIAPQRHDAAEACGILDYELHLSGVKPPWREEHILIAPLGAAA